MKEETLKVIKGLSEVLADIAENQVSVETKTFEGVKEVIKNYFTENPDNLDELKQLISYCYGLAGSDSVVEFDYISTRLRDDERLREYCEVKTEEEFEEAKEKAIEDYKDNMSKYEIIDLIDNYL